MKIGISSIDHIAPILDIMVIAKDLKHPQLKFSVLDVGCGKGVYGYILRAMFGKELFIEGVDPAVPEYFEYPIKLVYDELHQKTVQDFMAENVRRHNVILANHVMEHLPKDEAFTCIRQFKNLCDLLLIGLPQAKAEHEYKDVDGKDPHSHKWSYLDPDFRSLGLYHAVNIMDNMLYWWGNAGSYYHFKHLGTSPGLW